VADIVLTRVIVGLYFFLESPASLFLASRSCLYTSAHGSLPQSSDPAYSISVPLLSLTNLLPSIPLIIAPVTTVEILR
jgi:hypothetical protein